MAPFGSRSQSRSQARKRACLSKPGNAQPHSINRPLPIALNPKPLIRDMQGNRPDNIQWNIQGIYKGNTGDRQGIYRGYTGDIQGFYSE